MNRPGLAISVVALSWAIISCRTLPDPANASPDESGQRAVAFINVAVVPMDHEAVLPEQTVMVRDGKIVSIAPASEADVPALATRIDGTGKYLMPGLADMHVHLSNDGVNDTDMLPLFLANGVTTVRNMHGNPEILEWRRRIDGGDLVGPRIYTTGPILDGEPPFWPTSIVVRTPDEAEREVAAQKKAGYDGVKVLSNISPQAYEAVLAAAAGHEIPVYGHAPTRLGPENALSRGQRSFEHMSDLMVALLPEDSPVRAQLVEMWGDRTKVNWRGMFLDPYEQADRSKIPAFVANAAEGGAWFCPTLAVNRNYAATAAEFEQLRSDPTIRYVSPQEYSGWDWVARYLSTDENNDPAIMKRGFETMLLAMKALHDAGVGLIVGTDAPGTFVVPGFSLHEELEIFVEAGLTPFEALAAATRDAAEFVDASNEWGTVSVGRRADLILVDANPLDDVANASNPVGVMLRGRWFPREELQAKLDALAEKYANMKAEGEATTAIANVNVVPMDRETVLPDQTVMVRDGKIVSIAPASEADVPAFATLIDGTGKYLMPGLADMHAHLAHDEEADSDALVVFLAAGVTTVRNMWGQPVHLEWRRQINDGSLLGPNIYSTGPITDGEPPFWPGSSVVRTPDEAAEEVAAQKRAGYDGVKLFVGITPDVYKAILEAARAHDLPVYGHAPRRTGLRQALTSGQQSFEHLVDFTYALLPEDAPARAQLLDMLDDRSKRNWRGLFLDPYAQADRSRIPDLAAEAASAGVWFCPTLVVDRKYAATAAELDQFRSSPTMRYVPPQEQSEWEGTARFLSAGEGNDPAIMKRGFETMVLATRALHEAGARLIVGTDTGNPFVVAGFSVHEELRLFVDAGLTPYEAIKAATHDAAEFLDALDDWGTVAVGRRADLILVEANPLDDVANASEQVGVLVRGRWYPKAELQVKLDALAEKYEKTKAEGEATVAIENDG